MKKPAKSNKVIILKGSPGVGKSFTARKLISQLKNNKIGLISVDELLHIDQRKLKEDKLKLAKFHAAILTRSLLREDFDVIIEYTFDIPEHLEFLIDKIQHSHVEKLPKAAICVYHLTAKLNNVIKRNKSRRDGSDPLPKNVLERLYKKCEETAGKVQGEVIIQTDKIPLKRVVDQILTTI
jgi:tRNA uridine 5-carbamoylmethylation protein Kti12